MMTTVSAATVLFVPDPLVFLTQPSCKISMDVGILLNGVCDVNGVPLLVVRK